MEKSKLKINSERIRRIVAKSVIVLATQLICNFIHANGLKISDCYNIIYGCRECQDNSGIRTCTSCLDGYYLLTNTTLNGDSLTFCVPDCALANPQYINNPNTMKCEHCGDGCTACSQRYGCEMCPGVASQTSFEYYATFHPLGLSNQFKMCQKCHTVANNEKCMKCTGTSKTDIQCINCAYEISDVDCSQNSCTANSCSYNCPNSGCKCSEGLYVSGTTSCTACSLQNCLSCTSSLCKNCMRGFYASYSSGSDISSCNLCTSNNIFKLDCFSCINSGTSNPILACSTCHSSLVLDNKSCETSCPRGYYISTTTSQSNGVYDNNICTICTQGCYECAGSDTNQCLSCPKSNYLTYASSGSIIGTCSTNSGVSTTLNLFVKASYAESTGDGSYSNPFGNIVKALSYADEQCADKGETTINIYLLNGDHFMTRNFNHYNYFKSKSSGFSYNQNINIQPAFCGQTLGGHAFQASDTDCISTSSKITVYYQMGNTFRFTVPKSMTVSNIIFDALDSSLLPTESCLKENAKCCTLSGTTLSMNPSNPNPASSCTVQTIQTEECKATFGSSFFQFLYSDTLSSISGVGTLTISNCVFQNFFYDFTSFIGLTKDHGKVIVTGSTFDKFSNCGSIIRDTREYPTLDYSSTTATQSKLTYRDSMFAINLMKVKYFVEPTTSCISSSCSSISISLSTFTNFNYLKVGGHTYHIVSSTSKMAFQGIILNLIYFYGNVAINKNSFSGLKFKYNNCEEQQNSGTTLDTNNIWGTPTVTQQKSALIINVKSSYIEIYDNSFIQCNSNQGTVFVMRESSYNGGVLIHNNLFLQNSAIYGANVLKIFLYTSSSFYSSYNLSYMVCANVQISSNTFKNNFGCQYVRGVIFANCYTDGYDSSLANLAYYNYYADPPYSVASYILSKQGVVSFSIVNNVTMPNSLQKIDTNKFLLLNNTYDQNGIPGFRSINEFYNFRRIHMNSETYIGNLGQYCESLNKYGSISSNCNKQSILYSDSWSLYSYYGTPGTGYTLQDVSNINYLDQYYPVSPILIQVSLFVYIDGITFDNNYMQEINTKYLNSMYPSGAITFRMCKGILYLNSLTIQNYKGIDFNNLQTILGSDYTSIINYAPNQRDSNGDPYVNATYPEYIVDYGFKNSLIKFGRPSSISTYDYSNQFDICSFNTLNLYNITQYDPIKATPLFIDIDNDCSAISISNINIKDVDAIRGQTSIFGLKTYGSITITNGTIQNINKNAYSYDTTDFSYVPSIGGVFIFNSIQSNSTYPDSIYTFSNLTFDKIYGRKGCSFYFGTSTQVTTAHNNFVSMNSITIQNSVSYESGTITFYSGKQFVTISKSNFASNLGINCEADIKIITSGSLAISDSSFKLFSSSNLNSGQSITLEMNTPFTLTVKIVNTIIKCSDYLFDQNTYISYINAKNSQLNKQSPVLLNPGSLESTSSTFSNCFNSLTGGAIQVNSDSSFIDNGSTFTQNIASSGGAIYFRKSTGSFTNSIFTYNYADSGGAITLDSGSSIQTFTGVTCNYNYANNGGCINSIGESSISIRNSKFNYNYSNQSSSALYFLGAGESSVASSEISYNNANSKNTISLLFTPLTLTNVTFIDNISKEQSLGLFATFSSLSIQNSTFIIKNLPNSETSQENASLNSQITGCFILIGSSADLVITGSYFESGYSNYGGAIYVSGNSDITISETTFKNCYSSVSGGAIYATGFKTFKLTNCNFEGNSCGNTGTDLCIKSGETHIFNSKFMLKAGPSSINLESGEFYGENIVMTTQYQSNVNAKRNYYWMGSGIYGSSMNYFYLHNSSFTSLNYGTYGGAIYLLTLNTSKNKTIINPVYVFDLCNFESNSAFFGGAVYLEEVEYASFKSCNFKNNSAVSDSELEGGIGGAIYYQSSTNYSKVVFENTSTFEDNVALISGGGIYWNYIQPENILQQAYSNNNAHQYGSNYGCFAKELQIISETEYKSINASLRNLNSSAKSNSLSIINQQSGGTLNTFYVALVDQFNQIVSSDSSSTATISISGTYTGGAYSPILKGTTTQTASNGAFKFNDISFTAQPGSSYSLSISTTGIDSTKPSNAAYLSADSKTSSAMAVTIVLRTCSAGESFSSTGACTECASPDYYSLEKQTSPGSCKSCQVSRMYCKGGSDVGPKPGYWRSSLTSDNFISCLYYGACLGYVSPSNNKLGECFTGYQGTLCADCAVSFSKSSNYKCEKCPDPTWNIIRLFLIFLAITIGIVIIVRSTLTGALQKKNIQSIYIKLLMNHLQLLTLTSSFDLRWPDNVSSFFSSSNEVAQVTTQFLSFDCFLDQRNSGGSNIIRLYYQKMIMYALIPLIMAICSAIFWSLYFCIRKKLDPTKRRGRIMATLIILFFLIHPTIVQYMFSNFNCKTIDSESYITDDLVIQCWSSTHALYSLILAAPSLIVWGFGIPLYAWIILAKYKDNLDLIEIREKYGFLYNGYKKNFYFWESVNMYRKICVIFISVFLKLAGVITQALVIFLVLIIFLILNIKLKPFTFQALNDMEMLSLITCMLTIYCGLFFLSDMPEVYNSTDSSVKEADNGLRLNNGSKFFFFLIIIISNLVFLTYWTFKMYEELRKTVRSKMEKLYLFICLCGNKKKLEDEKLKQEIKDQNDILKEEFDIQLNKIRDLWNTNPKIAKLILTKENIEKSASFLSEKKYLEYISCKKDPTIEELKNLKRSKRKVYGEKFFKTLKLDISQSNNRRETTNMNMIEYIDSDIFESNINDFIELNRFSDSRNLYKAKNRMIEIGDLNENENNEDNANPTKNLNHLQNEESKLDPSIFLDTTKDNIELNSKRKHYFDLSNEEKYFKNRVRNLSAKDRLENKIENEESKLKSKNSVRYLNRVKDKEINDAKFQAKSKSKNFKRLKRQSNKHEDYFNQLENIKDEIELRKRRIQDKYLNHSIKIGNYTKVIHNQDKKRKRNLNKYKDRYKTTHIENNDLKINLDEEILTFTPTQNIENKDIKEASEVEPNEKVAFSTSLPPIHRSVGSVLQIIPSYPSSPCRSQRKSD